MSSSTLEDDKKLSVFSTKEQTLRYIEDVITTYNSIILEQITIKLDKLPEDEKDKALSDFKKLLDISINENQLQEILNIYSFQDEEKNEIVEFFDKTLKSIDNDVIKLQELIKEIKNDKHISELSKLFMDNFFSSESLTKKIQIFIHQKSDNGLSSYYKNQKFNQKLIDIKISIKPEDMRVILKENNKDKLISDLDITEKIDSILKDIGKFSGGLSNQLWLFITKDKNEKESFDLFTNPFELKNVIKTLTDDEKKLDYIKQFKVHHEDINNHVDLHIEKIIKDENTIYDTEEINNKIFSNRFTHELRNPNLQDIEIDSFYEMARLSVKLISAIEKKNNNDPFIEILKEIKKDSIELIKSKRSGNLYSAENIKRMESFNKNKKKIEEYLKDFNDKLIITDGLSSFIAKYLSALIAHKIDDELKKANSNFFSADIDKKEYNQNYAKLGLYELEKNNNDELSLNDLLGRKKREVSTEKTEELNKLIKSANDKAEKKFKILQSKCVLYDRVERLAELLIEKSSSSEKEVLFFLENKTDLNEIKFSNFKNDSYVKDIFQQYKLENQKNISFSYTDFCQYLQAEAERNPDISKKTIINKALTLDIKTQDSNINSKIKEAYSQIIIDENLKNEIAIIPLKTIKIENVLNLKSTDLPHPLPTYLNFITKSASQVKSFKEIFPETINPTSTIAPKLSAKDTNKKTNNVRASLYKGLNSIKDLIKKLPFKKNP